MNDQDKAPQVEAQQTIFEMKMVRGESGVRCVVEFPPSTDLLQALKIMGSAVTGLVATGVKMSEGRGVTDDQVLALMGLPVN